MFRISLLILYIQICLNTHKWKILTIAFLFAFTVRANCVFHIKVQNLNLNWHKTVHLSCNLRGHKTFFNTLNLHSCQLTLFLYNNKIMYNWQFIFMVCIFIFSSYYFYFIIQNNKYIYNNIINMIMRKWKGNSNTCLYHS